MKRNPFINHLSTSGSRKLICFPFAGGYSLSFRPFSQYWKDSDWQVLAINPSGHMMHSGPLLTDLNQMVELYLEALRPELNAPFALFGHSMGGLVAFLLAQKLEAEGLFPDMVFLSAISPPQIPRINRDELPDEEFLDYIISLGGIPPEFLQEKEYLRHFLPIFRADFQAVERHQQQNAAILRSPVHVFGGTQDENYTVEELQAWQVWAPHAELHWFAGGHMFLLDQPQEVYERMVTLLNRRGVYR